MPLPHPEVFAALALGVQLLIDDGKIRLEVEAAGDRATARVLVGVDAIGPQGAERGRRGTAGLGPDGEGPRRPRLRRAAGCRLGGAVVRPAARRSTRSAPPGASVRVHLVAKLEKPAAVERLDEIVARSTR